MGSDRALIPKKERTANNLDVDSVLWHLVLMNNVLQGDHVELLGEYDKPSVTIRHADIDCS